MYKYQAYETTSKPILNDTFMKLIPKMQTAWSPLVIQSDNTTVAKPAVDYRIKYKLKPGEFFYTDKSGKKHVGKSKEATVSQDNMTKQQKREADVKKKIVEQQEKEEKLNKGAEQLLETTKLMFPSTYIGPLFRDNGKSYTENLLSGEGTGNVIGNLAIDALLPYGVARSFTTGYRYAGQVASRYRFANQNLANPEDIKSVVEILGYVPNRGYYLSKPRYKTTHQGKITRNGQIAIKPGETSEIHFNPQFTIDENNGTLLNITPEPGLGKEAVKLIKNLPQHTVLASKSNSRSIPQVIPEQSWSKRMNYYLTGNIPKLNTDINMGYSTDIMELFKSRGFGTSTPSLTTKLDGLNTYGKSFNKYKKYFGKPNEDGFVKYADMTPEQVQSWNTEIAPTWGHYIDPETRTSEQMMLITK